MVNDHQLFHTVVETHGKKVLRTCASTVGPGPDAEDAWSETFVAALAAFPFPPETNIEAWLVRVAQRKCLDFLRSRRREMPLDASELASIRLVLPEGVTHLEDFDDELWRLVTTLSERQRFVLAHRYIAEWSYPEIAEKLGCSAAAARRAGADGIAALRKMRGSTNANPSADGLSESPSSQPSSLTSAESIAS